MKKMTNWEFIREYGHEEYKKYLAIFASFVQDSKPDWTKNDIKEIIAAAKTNDKKFEYEYVFLMGTAEKTHEPAEGIMAEILFFYFSNETAPNNILDIVNEAKKTAEEKGYDYRFIDYSKKKI